MPEFVFVTGNAGKLAEVQALLGERYVVRHRRIDLPELQGEPVEVALEKARVAAIEVKGPVIVEDTSLCYYALNGLPGPYIKWFLEKIGHAGLFKLLAGYKEKEAYAQCIFVYCKGPGYPAVPFIGRCEGKIVAPRGSTDFGWDVVFQPDGYEETFAEMPKATKNTISHRARALAKLRTWLES